MPAKAFYLSDVPLFILYNEVVAVCDDFYVDFMTALLPVVNLT